MYELILKKGVKILGEIIQFIITLVLVYIGGKLVQQFDLPAILGWLVVGMVLGPNVLNLLSNEIISSSWYSFIATISQMIVGVMIGSNLILEKVKKAGGDALKLTLSMIVSVLIIVTLGFTLLLSGMSMPIIVAFMIGAVAIATAPAPALSIIDEYNTDGPLSRTTVSMTVLNSVIVTLFFYGFISIFQSVYSDSNMSIVLTLSLMILVPILLGFFAGYLTSSIIDDDSRGKKASLIFFASLVLLTSLLLLMDNFLYPQPLVNFILAGAAFAAGFVNFEDDGVRERTGQAFAPIQSMGLLILIVNLAAPLDPSLLLSSGLWSLVYIVLRASGYWLGGFIGGKIIGADKNVQKYIGLTMLPHSGVALVNTGVAAGALALIFPGYASFIQTLIPAAAIINELLAVLIGKKAYEWAGEIDMAEDSEEDFIREKTSHRAIRPYDDSYYQNKRHPKQKELKRKNTN